MSEFSARTRTSRLRTASFGVEGWTVNTVGFESMDDIHPLYSSKIALAVNYLYFFSPRHQVIDHRPAESQGRQMARRLEASDEEMAAIPMHHAARSAHWNRPTGMKIHVE